MATQAQIENQIRLLETALQGDANATEEQTQARQSALEKARASLAEVTGSDTAAAAEPTSMDVPETAIEAPEIETPEVEPSGFAIRGAETPEVEVPDVPEVEELQKTGVASQFSDDQIRSIMRSDNNIFFNKATGELVWRDGDIRVVLGGDNEGVDPKWVDFAERKFEEITKRTVPAAGTGEAPDTVMKEGEAPEGDIIPEVTLELPEDATASEISAAEELAEMEAQAAEAVGEEKLASAQQAKEQGYLNDEEYRSYLEKVAPSAEEKLVEATTTDVIADYEPPAQVQVAGELNNIAEMDFSSMGSFINTLLGDQDLSEMSSAAINQILLAQLTMGATQAQQQAMSNLYAQMAQRAEDAYLSTIDAVGTAAEEIDNIISGTSDVASTISSLQVKVAKQQQDLGLASIEAQEAALTAEYEYTFNQMLEQNSRLEGYMKAKLNYMGAQDSSAGLTIMVTAIDNAQQRLMLYQTKHSAEMVQLEVTKTGLMNDYYNAVSEQLINLQGAEGSALADYNSRMDEIEANQLASEAEAQTMMLSTLGGLFNSLYTIETDQRNWEYQLATDAYNRALTEAEIARDIENQEKTVALNFLDRLIASGAGSTLGELPEDIQRAILDLQSMVGLPESYASQSLESLRASMLGSGSGGAGGGFSQEDIFLYQQAKAEYEQAGGFDMTGKTFSEWTKSALPSSQAQSVIDINSMIEGEGASQITRVAENLGISPEEVVTRISGATDVPTPLQITVDDVFGGLIDTVTSTLGSVRDKF